MKLARLVAALCALFLVIGVAAETDARPRKAAGWTLLGQRTVTDRHDRDTIHVAVREGSFTKLQVRVKRRSVEMHEMKVHFANGQVWDVKLRRVIPAGGSSRVIDLPATRRVITKVTFSYDAQSIAGGKATVRLFGRR